jgi:hypothetical protein
LGTDGARRACTLRGTVVSLLGTSASALPRELQQLFVLLYFLAALSFGLEYFGPVLRFNHLATLLEEPPSNFSRVACGAISGCRSDSYRLSGHLVGHLGL